MHIIIRWRSSLISQSVNTSLPNRKGIRKKSNFVNSAFPMESSVTFFISNLAAFDPMSMAA